MSDASSRSSLVIPALAPLYGALSPLVDPLLRVVAGLWLVPHGAQKLFGLWAGPNSPVGFEALSAAFEKYMGLPGFLGPLAALLEFIGGILLVLGLLTRPVAAVIFVEFLVIVFQVHLPRGFFASGGGIRVSPDVVHSRSHDCHSRRRPLVARPRHRPRILSPVPESDP